MSSKNVLYPLWRSQQHISGVLRRDILQEIRSLVVRLLLQSLRRLSTVLVGIIQPLLFVGSQDMFKRQWVQQWPHPVSMQSWGPIVGPMV